MKEYLLAFMEYEEELFWTKDVDSAEKRIEMWLNSDECKALNMHFVIKSDCPFCNSKNTKGYNIPSCKCKDCGRYWAI